MSKRKLTKSATDRWIGGVFGGIGEYLHINPTILRIAYIILAIAIPPHWLISLLAVVLYGVLLWFLPNDRQQSDASFFNLFGDLFSGQSASQSSRSRARKQIHAEERDVHENKGDKQ
ncbi:PspC domain-containing protein [Furfurilactobacillus milii]|uniref:PspC domain-containing protein n=1 Tax=Furfurilactobacillus milii TaxID=2888272 RepID=A0A6N9I5P0_9LACO|nr:PspC domain-containing protein [Furfurilactobacillus milii]MYV18290.1 PspC domain-containing protein [Furfurilactobacillus milii]